MFMGQRRLEEVAESSKNLGYWIKNLLKVTLAGPRWEKHVDRGRSGADEFGGGAPLSEMVGRVLTYGRLPRVVVCCRGDDTHVTTLGCCLPECHPLVGDQSSTIQVEGLPVRDGRRS